MFEKNHNIYNTIVKCSDLNVHGRRKYPVRYCKKSKVIGDQSRDHKNANKNPIVPFTDKKSRFFVRAGKSSWIMFTFQKCVELSF